MKKYFSFASTIAFCTIITVMVLMVLYTQNSLSDFPVFFRINTSSGIITFLGKDYLTDISFFQKSAEIFKYLWELNKYVFPFNNNCL